MQPLLALASAACGSARPRRKPHPAEIITSMPLDHVTLRANLEAHVDALEGVRNPYTAPEGHQRAREYIQARLGRFGPVEVQSFPAGATPGAVARADASPTVPEVAADPVGGRSSGHGLGAIPRASVGLAPGSRRPDLLSSRDVGLLSRDSPDVDLVQGKNLLLSLPGRREGPAFLVGAHYDTVADSPGADDNASGVAVMLEVARLCAEDPPALPVHFAAFDLEERGPVGWGALGSRAMAARFRRDRKPLTMVFSLEMVGVADPAPGTQRYPLPLRWFYPSRADFLLMLGNPGAGRRMRRLGKSLGTAGVPVRSFWVPLRGWMVPSSRRSDHAPFWDHGYSAVLLTDTAFLRSPHYHKPTDTKDTLDFGFMAGIASGLAEFLQAA